MGLVSYTRLISLVKKCVCKVSVPFAADHCYSTAMYVYNINSTYSLLLAG